MSLFYLKRWLFGRPAAENDNQHIYRQTGKIIEEEDMTYEPGWWQRTGLWMGKSFVFVGIAVALISATVVSIDAGCSI